MLVPTLTVAGNVALGLKSARGVQRSDVVAARIETSQTLQAKGRSAPMSGNWRWVSSNGLNHQGALSGCRAAHLDEPTAVPHRRKWTEFCHFAPDGSRRTQPDLYLQVARGFDLSNRVTVMRDGKVIATTRSGDDPSATGERNGRNEVICNMIARPPNGEARLRISNLWSGRSQRRRAWGFARSPCRGDCRTAGVWATVSASWQRY